MHVTVAICTRNRAQSLGRTLASLERMDAPGCDWEVLVTDNGSTDATQGIIAQFAGRLPLRGQVAAEPGISHARNVAVAGARGTYIAWTDDDVVVDAGWLAAYVRAFARWPEAAIFGGPIVPVLLEPCPAWFRAVHTQLGPALAARDLGDEPIALSVEGDRIPFGANFAVRTEEHRRFGYDTVLGSAPGRVRIGEETALVKAMLEAGLTGRWVPDCRVEHITGPERQTTQYIARYFEGHGNTGAVQGEALQGPMIWGAPRWLWYRVLTRGAGYYLARLVSPPEKWVPKLVALSLDRGRLRYFLSPDR